jgi:soluble lytic murein transglycosylase-like protein
LCLQGIGLRLSLTPSGNRQMLQIECLGVRVHKQLLFLACFLGFLAASASGQTVRISDADVNIADLAGVSASEIVVPLAKSEIRGKRSGGQKLVKLTSREWNSQKSELRDAIIVEAARYKIDPDLVFALVWQESRWNVRAVSPKNARGPMQLMPGTAARFGVTNPHDPRQAVRGGVAYLVFLLDRFGGNVSLALASYNAGEGAVDSYLLGRTLRTSSGKLINPRGIKTSSGRPPYKETEDYVRRIAGMYRLIRAQRLAALTSDRSR